MTLTERTTWCIIHHQERNTIHNSLSIRAALLYICLAPFHTELQHPHDMRMNQVCNSAALSKKVHQRIRSQTLLQHFDRGLCLEKPMFSKIDIRKGPISKQANKTIITKPLPHTVIRPDDLFWLMLYYLFCRNG